MIAYKPVWAIGTGRMPTADEIAEVHLSIRKRLTECPGGHGAEIPILYIGSVTSENAGEILRTPEVGGLLIGGPSLKAADFGAILRVPSADSRQPTCCRPVNLQ